MNFGKIKEAWPVWVLVIAGFGIIALAVTQNQVEKEAVTFQDIFPEENGAPSGADDKAAMASSAMMDPVQSPAIVANSDSGFQVMYAVQLYSFKDKARADVMVNTLKSQGHPAYMQMSDLGAKGTWYRVRVGSFATAEEAKALLAEIGQEHQGSIVVKEKK